MACDIAFLERFWHPGITVEEAGGLVDAIRRKCRHFVYTLDDNLLDLGLEAPWRSPIGDEQRAAVRLFAREADGVIVSTRRLADRFSRLARRIEIVGNALDETLFQQAAGPVEESPQTDVRAVYMGTGTHQGDLLLVLEALRRVLKRHKGRFQLDLVGVVADDAVLPLFRGLPVRTIPGFGGLEYPQFAAWWAANAKWDFGIAPLCPTSFNTYKSDIKFLDYGIVGVPGIFSDITPYSETIVNGETGFLCGCAADEWEEGLELLIGNPDLRRHLAQNARAVVERNRILSVRAGDWLDALENICGRSNERQ
jgi:glycosyltransferase involved in cell wall biosynthesis